MKEDVQEFVIASERTGEYPFTREDSFERKLRRHRRRQQMLMERRCPQEEAIAYLERVEIEQVLERAGLTPRQRVVCERYLGGWTLQEIGAQMGVTKQAVAKTLKFAILKLRRAWHLNPYYGLAEVYRKEISRYGKR
ncbi:MAG: sigma factor-like helix-turn-helix DNA-binding protein [Fimbriimonadales bacterium]